GHYDLLQYRIGRGHLVMQHRRRVIHLIPQTQIQRECSGYFPVVLEKSMFVAHRGYAEFIPREGPLRLEWQAEQEIRKRVAGVCVVENEIAPAVRGIDRGSVVVTEKPAGFEHMRAAQPCHAVADLAGVVAKNDWHEGVLVESQIAAD